MKNQIVPGWWCLQNSCSDATDLESSSVHGHVENHDVLSSSSPWKQSHRSLQSSKEVFVAQAEWSKKARVFPNVVILVTGPSLPLIHFSIVLKSQSFSIQKKVPITTHMSMPNAQSHYVDCPLILVCILQCLALPLVITILTMFRLKCFLRQSLYDCMCEWWVSMADIYILPSQVLANRRETIKLCWTREWHEEKVISC